MSPQYGKLRPTNGWDRFPVWGSPANCKGFRVLASLLQRRHTPEANQTLHDVWPSPGLLHYVYIFGRFCLSEFCQVQTLLCVQVLRSPMYWQRYCTALQQGASARLCSVVQEMELRNFHRGCHLYSAGRPSRWASAHILVCYDIWCLNVVNCYQFSRYFKKYVSPSSSILVVH